MDSESVKRRQAFASPNIPAEMDERVLKIATGDGEVKPGDVKALAELVVCLSSMVKHYEWQLDKFDGDQVIPVKPMTLR